MRSPSAGTGAAPEGARYLVAGFWRRALAAILDGLCLLPLILLFGGATSAVAGQKLPRLGELGFSYVVALAASGGLPGQVALGVAGLVVLLYVLIFVAVSGATPGMRLLGMRVIDAFGDPPSLVRTFIRLVGLVLGVVVFCLGIIWIAFSREKRGFADLLAGTWVVFAKPVSTPPPVARVPVAGAPPAASSSSPVGAPTS